MKGARGVGRDPEAGATRTTPQEERTRPDHDEMDERQRSPHLTSPPDYYPGRSLPQKTRSYPPSRQTDQLPPPTPPLQLPRSTVRPPPQPSSPPPIFPANRTSDSLSPPGLHSHLLDPSSRCKSRSPAKLHFPSPCAYVRGTIKSITVLPWAPILHSSASRATDSD